MQLFWKVAILFLQITPFQRAVGEAKVSALGNYLDLPVASGTGFCVGGADGSCVKYVNVQLTSRASVIPLTSLAKVRSCAL